MTTSSSQKKSAFRLPIQKNSQILALFAIVCTAIVGLVHELTKDRIKAQAQQQLLNTLHSIIEPSRYDNDMTQNCITLQEPLQGNSQKKSTEKIAYIARKNGNTIAMAITNTAPDGYNGNIELIIAINMDNSVSGVRVLKHQETPGLGDKIEHRKSNWITTFNNKKLLSDQDDRWNVTKDGGMFDQFTGATITPRAVVNTVKNTVLYFKNNKHSLLTQENSCLIDEQTSQADSKGETRHEQ